MAIYEDVRVIYTPLITRKGEEPGELKQRLLEGISWELPVMRLGKGILTAFTGLTIMDWCGGEWFVDEERRLYKVTGEPEEPMEAIPWGRDVDILV